MEETTRRSNLKLKVVLRKGGNEQRYESENSSERRLLIPFLFLASDTRNASLQPAAVCINAFTVMITVAFIYI